MKKFIYHIRKWHNWFGAVFTLPLFIIALTGIVFAFQDSFKNTPGEPLVNVSWMPGYSKSALRHEFEKKSKEVFSVVLAADSTYFYGTGAGLFFIKKKQSGFISGLTGKEIRCLAIKDEYLFAGGKQGLFSLRLSDKSVSTILAKDIHSITFLQDSSLLVSDKKGIYQSVDNGTTWKKHQLNEALYIRQVEPGIMANNKIPLHKFNMDLHTGKAFFGKKNEWIWIVIVSLSLLILTFTGIYMWLKKKIKKQLKT